VVSPFPLGGVQRQVKVGSPHDAAEHEAERVADHVTSGPAKGTPTISRIESLQRQVNRIHEHGEAQETGVHRADAEAQKTDKPAEAVQRWGCCPEEERPSGTASIYRKSRGEPETGEPVRRKSVGEMDAAAAHAVSTKGAGEPLRPHVRQTLEGRMGVDLSGVRVHEGPAAHESAAAINARAFTHRNDIWLGRGESQENVHLIAHEATHVVQQGTVAPAPAATVTGTSNAPAQKAPDSIPSSPPAAMPSAPAVSSASSAISTAKAGGGAVPAKAPGEKPAPESGDPKAGNAAGNSLPSAAQKRRPVSPQSDPAYLAVTQHVKNVAGHQKAHAPASSKAAAAHAAVVSPSNEVPSRAAAKQTDAMDQQEPKPFDRAAFKAALLKKIEDTAPKTLEAADNFKNDNNLGSLKSDLNSQVAKDKKESQGPLADKVAETPNTSGIEPKPVTPLEPPDAGAIPQMSAAGAAPKPASDEEISLQAGPQGVDRQMADAKVTDKQLQESNEPDFQSALRQKKDLEKESVAAPRTYRAEEPGLLHAAQAEAQTTAVKQIGGIHGGRQHAFGGVRDRQGEARAEEEKQRDKIFGDIEKIYTSTKNDVEARLRKLDTDVNTTFDAGAADAQKAFENYVDVHMSAYKEERYDRIGGGLLWAKDKLFGMPDEVEAFYQEGRDLYLSRMDQLIDRIAAMVESGLNEAKGTIAAGKAAIQTYLAGLSPALQETGKKAAAGIQHKFDSLEQSITDHQDELIDSLAKKYNDNLQKVNARIEQMKEENSGLVHKVAGAIKGVIEAIIHLKDLLLNVLSRAATAIGLIIEHPIRFLGNLVDAGKRGFLNFKDHIVEHLKEGFMQWLFGAIAATGIQLPRNFDLAGILNLAMQLLGLTYAHIRARAVNILGEKMVKALETAAEIFKLLITKGPGALWEYIKEKIGSLLPMVIDKIKTFVMEKIVIAGITWLIGLLNPASAFVKACKAIYDIVMFFVERGSQILDLVNAIIDSITAIAQGRIDEAAAFVENALARSIPVIIGFLASLLGVGGISDKIKEVIEAIRKPIDEAIDWVINKAVNMVKAVGGFLGLGKKDKPDDRTDEQKKADLDKAIGEAEALQQDPDATEETIRKGLLKIKQKYNMVSLDLVVDSEDDSEETVHATGEINPKKAGQKSRIPKFDDPTEGLAGTYTGLQGKKGDKMTPDHEPQHALMDYVSGLTTRRFKGFQKPFKGIKVEDYSKGAGISLNMYQERHYRTRTYGASPASAIAKIRSDLAGLPEDSPVEKVRSTVKQVVDGELKDDQDRVRDIYDTDYKAKKVSKKTRDRALAGSVTGVGEVKSRNQKWWV
jgi:hypothetical protein